MCCQQPFFIIPFLTSQDRSILRAYGSSMSSDSEPDIENDPVAVDGGPTGLQLQEMNRLVAGLLRRIQTRPTDESPRWQMFTKSGRIQSFKYRIALNPGINNTKFGTIQERKSCLVDYKFWINWAATLRMGSEICFQHDVHIACYRHLVASSYIALSKYLV